MAVNLRNIYQLYADVLNAEIYQIWQIMKFKTEEKQHQLRKHNSKLHRVSINRTTTIFCITLLKQARDGRWCLVCGREDHEAIAY